MTYPRIEIHNTCNKAVRYFRQYGANNKSNPAVNLRVGFSRFVDLAEIEVSWLELLD